MPDVLVGAVPAVHVVARLELLKDGTPQSMDIFRRVQANRAGLYIIL